MNEFDYFSDRAKPVSPDELAKRVLPVVMEEEIQAWYRRRRRAMLAAITATLIVAVSAWYLWGYRDQIAYSFARSQPPFLLGDVTELSPADIPHNAYVEVSGITEHRGLTQKISLGLWPHGEERWYFRLLGSRGVFIEVPPDPERYGVATRVTVRGRAVDPARSSVYTRYLVDYGRRFRARPQDVGRVIQVAVEPGQGRGQFLALLVFICLVAIVDIYTLYSFVRHSRRRLGIMR